MWSLVTPRHSNTTTTSFLEHLVMRRTLALCDNSHV